MTNSTPIDDIPIGGEGIRLGQFLKFAGLLDSGGNVKEAIIDGYVMVNGEVIASDTPDNIRVNPDVQTAYLGDAHEH